MTSIVRMLIGAGAVLGLASLSISIAEAQQSTAKQKPAGAHAEGRDAEAALDRARRALDEGKAETARQLADGVLTSRHKDARSTARALAIRGEAHLGMGRPAEAAADLESALWLKDGLSGRDRALATAARSKAMQAGGIAGAAPPVPTPPVSAPQRAPEVAPQVVSRAPVPAAAQRQPEPVRQPPAWSNSSVSVVPAAPPARVVTGERPIATAAAPSRRPDAVTSEALPSSSWSTAPRPSPAPERKAEVANQGGGGISGFFSSLFGGAQSVSQSSEALPSTTAAVGSTAPPRMPAVSSSAPQRSASEPPVSRSPVPPPRSAPSVPPPARAAAMFAPANQVPERPPEPVASSDGTYKVQLAAVRSKAEAVTMAQQLRAEEAALVGSRSVEIVEDVYGNMGRFYRVRIGPFAEPTQALSTCASLRERRMDCMVLDR